MNIAKEPHIEEPKSANIKNYNKVLSNIAGCRQEKNEKNTKVNNYTQSHNENSNSLVYPFQKKVENDCFQDKKNTCEISSVTSAFISL